MTDSLNERFKTFISQLPSAEVIDELKLPSEFDESKRADFLIENRKAVIELKSLESDPEHKVHTEFENHKKRDEYPLFYAELEGYKIIKHLPDDDELVKSQKVRFPVIPAKAGIQLFQILKNSLDSGFHRSDDFLRDHQRME